MVSLNPNHLSEPDFCTDPMTALTTTTTPPPSPPSTTSLEDLSKKTRKPYSISKSRESWTEQEHDNFLKALQLFDRDWKKIEVFVGSKTVIQIRSHAQKYFLKVQKNGTSEHVPPPRPKKKSAHQYPQKAIKNAPSVSQMMGAVQTSSDMLEPGYILRPDSSSIYRNSLTSPVVSWPHNSLPPVAVSHATKVVPDFVQVYNFIGSVFDPDRSGHLQNLKQMDPIDIETVLLLMRNLSVNLPSFDFEDHRTLLSAYDVDIVKAEPGSANTMGSPHQPE